MQMNQHRATREEFGRCLGRAWLPPLLLLAGLAAFVSLVLFRLQQMVLNAAGADSARFESFTRACSLAVLCIIGVSMSLGIGLALLNRRTFIRLTSIYQQVLEAEA